MNCPTCDIEYKDDVPHPPAVCAEHAGKEMWKAKKALDGALDQISKAAKDREEIKDLIARILSKAPGSKMAYRLSGDHEAVKRIFEWLSR
jgi:hypothetical protein